MAIGGDGFLWKFSQLSGISPKTLTLGGWQAPFGRPRNGDIFNAGLEIRYSRTDYPGKNLPPTIHKFGSMGKPIDLHGRWMDRMIQQVGGAQQYVQNWKSFVNDAVIVRMSWGGIISYQIFIHEIDLKFEGPGDVVWSIKAAMLVDEQQPIATPIDTSTTPFDIASQMQALMANLEGFNVGDFGDLLGMLNQVSDQLTVLKGQLNAPFATIYNTCSALSSFESAVSSDLTSMLSGISAMRTGVLNLRDTTDFVCSSASELNTPNSVALNDINGGVFTGANILKITATKQTVDISISNMLVLLAQLQQQIDQTRRGGTPRAAYVALAGDTWEIAGERVMGSADLGRKIRDMNGVRHGEQPIAGRQYTVPSQ